MAADFGSGMRRQTEKSGQSERADHGNRRKSEPEVECGKCVLASATQEKGCLQRDAAKSDAQTKTHLLRDVHQCGRGAALCRSKVHEGKREKTRQSKRAKAASEDQEHHDRPFWGRAR